MITSVIDKKIVPIILCGGESKRLNPLTDKNNPKQFLKLTDNKSLLGQTIERVSNKDIFLPPIICSTENYKDKILSELKEIGINEFQLVLEPESRNTAPAICAASIFVANEISSDSNLLFLPCDHHFSDEKVFERIFQDFDFEIIKEKILIFGIKPNYASSKYGYVKSEDDSEKTLILNVAQFIEKPSIKKAEEYLMAKNYLWNGGIYFASNKTMLNEFKKYSPQTFNICKKSVENISRSPDKQSFILGNEYLNNVSNSVDKEISEKSGDMLVIKIDNSGWEDLGSFEAIKNSLSKTAAKNINSNDYDAKVDIEGSIFARKNNEIIMLNNE